MIRINQLKLPVDHTHEELLAKAAKTLKTHVKHIQSIKIRKRSIDARDKDQLLYSYCIDVKTTKEESVLRRAKTPNVVKIKPAAYHFPLTGKEKLTFAPIIIGSGPAGLFCGLMLASHGYRPVILERGDQVEQRKEAVEAFWKTGVLDPDSNVQFGEGGAGTFSDGKLNTLVKDPFLRSQKVLEIFAEFGADPQILYVAKPHIGTDVLSQVVKNIRQEIIRLGGSFQFRSQVTDFYIQEGRLAGLQVNGAQRLDAQVAVVAIGHSARDTLAILGQRGVPMGQKPFAAGLRIQHPQKMINMSQYGCQHHPILGPASYKLTNQTGGGRGVYSFCMCPGGYVVDASSERGRLAVNGMSNQARDGENANSALIVTVSPKDYPDASPLAGIAYQRRLEELAFCFGEGKIPIQLYGDFKAGKMSTGFGDVGPEFKGQYQFADLTQVLPEYLARSLVEGVEAFGYMIPGFDRYDAILAGVESRSSSPVRINRGKDFESLVEGIYPCGEGAGYAGGITSAAMDGIKVAEALAARFRP